MSGPDGLRTVVADTSALVSLGVPKAVSEYDVTSDPDPLQYLLTSCDVSVPPEVTSELHDVAQYEDVHGAAATDVLAASAHYAVEDPYRRAETPDDRPTFGLDDGETDAIVLANGLDADWFLTDEFGGTNFALIHAVLEASRIVPTPRLVVDYARNGHLRSDEARTLLSTIGDRRSWDDSPYVSQIRDLLD